MYPSKSVANVLLRFMSTPHAFRTPGRCSCTGAAGAGVDPRRPEVGRRRIVRLLAADDAVVGHVAPLLREVVHRVVRPVRVRGRQDEDVEVVDELPRPRVDRVVAEQLLGGLEAGQRRRPLACVLLAVEEHADLRSVAVLADPHHGVLERPPLDVRVGRGREEVRQVDLQARLDDSNARIAAVGERNEQRIRRGARVDRCDDLRCRARERAGRVRSQADGRSFPLMATVSGELATPGCLNSAVMSFPPSWPHARDVSTTVCDCAVAPRGCSCPGSSGRPCSPAPSADSRSSCAEAESSRRCSGTRPRARRSARRPRSGPCTAS